ncbi:alanine racemase [Enterococcus faecium]|uniref:alanine racemase n=1 Tax=Enterococcus faecium TaxID=1352 RepID=UPI000DA9EC1E|nr:alanine racemase [Enterococcus faecium]MCK1011279.1 alanine racemase [Enterococcus faecium]MCK1029296.1 alanine racemase [Enterococcus faecium]PZM69504.1 hypothetical protein DMB20_15780 [Enterococcus faecium]HBK4033473.1 alanine racemase [Enterococcus faecium]HBK4039235.1 alanine racemase [Enterococcus faecium]
MKKISDLQRFHTDTGRYNGSCKSECIWARSYSGSKNFTKNRRDEFCGCTLDEGIQLRNNGITGQILILGYTQIDLMQLVYKYDLTQTIVSEDYGNQIVKSNTNVKVQIAVDTVMHRIGFNETKPKHCAEIIRSFSKTLNITGCFTHLCCVDTKDIDDTEFTNQQIRRFE